MSTRKLGEHVEFTRDCELGKMGECAEVIALNGPYMTLVVHAEDHAPLVHTGVIHTSADYLYLRSCDAIAPRWTREGRCIYSNRKPGFAIDRASGPDNTSVLSPVECDAIADLLCRTLNEIDLDALVRAWMAK